MSQPLARIEFETTIDELVDANMRLANRTRHYQEKKRRTALMTAIVPVIGALMTGPALGQALPIGIAFGAMLGFGIWHFYDHLVSGQLRKAMTAGLGGMSSIRGEIELRPDEVWLRQHGDEMTFPWSQSAGVADTGDALELRFSPGLVVVRNRFFESTAERQTFLDTARTLAVDQKKILSPPSA